jgi:1-acyl-sn-glycerol-3-phosphate acyltransferase
MVPSSLAQPVAAVKVSRHSRGLTPFKLLALVLELSRFTLVLCLRFPRLQPEQKLTEIQRWASKVLQILQVEVRVEGSPPPPGASLVVANHVSWLDILVLQSLLPGVFVAKAEVRRWPLIGTMAQHCSTIFVDRRSRTSARGMVDGALKAFDQGYAVIAFPEGTSTDGTGLNPFHANVFEGAISAQIAVVPVAMRYMDAQTGLPCQAAPFIGDMSLAFSLRKVMAKSTIQVRVHLGDVIPTKGQTRKSVSIQAHLQIRTRLESFNRTNSQSF